MRYLLVAVGGGLAALARYSATIAVGVRTFPYATLAVNVTGAFFFGVVITLTSAGRIPKDIGTAATVGFLGAYTTFATFAWEVFVLVHTDRVSMAGAYVGLSVGLGVTAGGAGYFLGRLMVAG
jgi:fluoride exporter